MAQCITVCVALLFGIAVHAAGDPLVGAAAHDDAGSIRVGDGESVAQSALVCGPRCLLLVGRVLGKTCSLEDILAKVKVTPLGVSMLDLKEAAQALGVPMVGVRCDPLEPDRVPLPMIAHTVGGHYVVVMRDGPDGLEVLDPVASEGTALRRLSHREFAEVWDGAALALSARDATRRSSLRFADYYANFGVCEPGGNVTLDFVCQNKGNDTVRILRTRRSCGSCTDVSVGLSELPPGAQTTVAATLNLATDMGFVRKWVAVETDEVEEPRHLLWIEGFVQGRLNYAPREVDFGEVPAGSEAHMSVWILPRGTPAGSIGVACPESVSATATHLQVPSVSGSSRTMEAVRVDLTYRPCSLDAPPHGQIVVATGDQGIPRIVIPFTSRVVSSIKVLPGEIAFTCEALRQTEHTVHLAYSTAEAPVVRVSSVSRPWVSASLRHHASMRMWILEVSCMPPQPRGEAELDAEIALSTTDRTCPAVSIPIRIRVKGPPT